jgi:hypothetical protein
MAAQTWIYKREKGSTRIIRIDYFVHVYVKTNYESDELSKGPVYENPAPFAGW